MSYGSQTRNHHEDTEQDEQDAPVYCHGCKGYLGQRQDLTPQIAEVFNGWWYCPEHAAELRELAPIHDPFNEARR